jgi:hypothetical protein
VLSPVLPMTGMVVLAFLPGADRLVPRAENGVVAGSASPRDGDIAVKWRDFITRVKRLQ